MWVWGCVCVNSETKLVAGGISLTVPEGVLPYVEKR